MGKAKKVWKLNITIFQFLTKTYIKRINLPVSFDIQIHIYAHFSNKSFHLFLYRFLIDFVVFFFCLFAYIFICLIILSLIPPFLRMVLLYGKYVLFSFCLTVFLLLSIVLLLWKVCSCVKWGKLRWKCSMLFFLLFPALYPFWIDAFCV